MASFTLNDYVFPAGTAVAAYTRSNWPGGGTPSGAPIGASAAAGVMVAGGITFTGLAEDGKYFAYGVVNGRHRYVAFTAGDADSYLPKEDRGPGYAYRSGSGTTTITIPVGGKLLSASCAAGTSPATMIVNGGDPIGVPAGGDASLATQGRLAGPFSVVFDSTSSWGVDWVP